MTLTEWKRQCEARWPGCIYEEGPEDVVFAMASDEVTLLAACEYDGTKCVPLEVETARPFDATEQAPI